MHWDYSVSIAKELVDGKGCLFWSHCEVSTDWEQEIMRFVKFIDDSHVSENTGVTSVVNAEILKLGELNYPTSWSSTVYKMPFMKATA